MPKSRFKINITKKKPTREHGLLPLNWKSLEFLRVLFFSENILLNLHGN